MDLIVRHAHFVLVFFPSAKSLFLTLDIFCPSVAFWYAVMCVAAVAILIVSNGAAVLSISRFEAST